MRAGGRSAATVVALGDEVTRERVRPMGYNAARRVKAAIDQSKFGIDALNNALRWVDRDPDEAVRLMHEARYTLSEIRGLLLEALNGEIE